MSGMELIREGFQEEMSFETCFEVRVWIFIIGRHEDDVQVVWTSCKQLWARMTQKKWILRRMEHLNEELSVWRSIKSMVVA